MTAREMVSRLSEATGPVRLIIPVQGIEEWDRIGQPAHDPEGLAAFLDEVRICTGQDQVPVTELDCHINDDAFAAAVLDIFDSWVREGLIPTTRR